MRVRRFLHLLLFVGVVLLLWQVVVTWNPRLPVPQPAAPQGGQEDPPLSSLPALAPGAEKELEQVIADKDLFSPTRNRETPVDEEGAAVVTVPPPSHLKLVGVVFLPGRKEALFSDSSQGGKVVRVRLGDTLGAYRLVTMAPTEVTLGVGQDGSEVRMLLAVADSATAARMPRPLLTALQTDATRRAHQAALSAGAGQPGVAARVAQNETQAIRQNIVQLQRRLRQIRRRAARDASEEGAENGGGDEDEE